MAENSNQKYSYHEMSNKVEMADRSLLRARAHEPTGEVETLRGRSDVGRMGDRVVTTGKTHPLELQEKLQRKKHKTDGTVKESVVHASGGQSILDFENLTGYQPTTQRARGAYETILVRFAYHLFDCLKMNIASHLYLSPATDYDWLQIIFRKPSNICTERCRGRGHHYSQRSIPSRP